MVRISLVPALTPLYLYVSTFRSMCAVPNMAVFCSSLTSWFPGMLLLLLYNIAYNIFPLSSFILALSDGILYVTCTRAKLLLFTLWYLEFMAMCVVGRTLKMEAESPPKLRFTVTYRLPGISLIALLVVKYAVAQRMFLLSDVSHRG